MNLLGGFRKHEISSLNYFKQKNIQQVCGIIKYDLLIVILRIIK